MAFSDEGKLLVNAVPIDTHQIADADLLSCQKIRQRVNDVSLNGALQVPCAIALIGSFRQKEIASGGCNAE